MDANESTEKSGWIGVPTSSGWLSGMTLDLTTTTESPGTGTMNGSGMMVVLFSMAGSWANITFDGTFNGTAVSGTLSGLLDPAQVTGTINGPTSMTLGGNFGAFGNVTWNLTMVAPVSPPVLGSQITGLWSGTFADGQSLDVSLLQTGNTVGGIGTLDIIIQSQLTSINVVVSGSANYPSFDLTVSTINPQFFSVGLAGTATDDNTLSGTFSPPMGESITLTRQAP
jgi:hypothetical protein